MFKYKFTVIILLLSFAYHPLLFSFQQNKQEAPKTECLAPRSLLQDGLKPAAPTNLFYRFVNFVNRSVNDTPKRRQKRLRNKIKLYTMIAIFTALSSCSDNYEALPENINNNYSQSDMTQYQQNGFNFEIVNNSDIAKISSLLTNLCQDAGLSQPQRESIKKVIIVNQEDMTIEGGNFVPMYVNYDDPGVVYVNANVLERDLNKGRYNMLVHVWSHELMHLIQLYNKTIANNLYDELVKQKAIPKITNPRSLTILTEDSEIIWAHDSSNGIYKGFPSPYSASGHPMKPVEETQKFEFYAEVSGLASRLFYFYNSIQGNTWQEVSLNERYLHYQRAYQYVQDLNDSSNNSLLIAFKIYQEHGFMSKNTFNSVNSLISLIDTSKPPLTKNEFNVLFPAIANKAIAPFKLKVSETSS